MNHGAHHELLTGLGPCESPTETTSRVKYPNRDTVGSEERLSLTLPSSEALLLKGYSHGQLHRAGGTGGSCWQPWNTTFSVHSLPLCATTSLVMQKGQELKMEPQQKATSRHARQHSAVLTCMGLENM